MPTNDTDYRGWTNSRTWCANLYLELERTAYEDISATRKRGELVTAAQVKGWFERLHLKCDAWTAGTVNWQEISDNYNDQAPFIDCSKPTNKRG